MLIVAADSCHVPNFPHSSKRTGAGGGQISSSSCGVFILIGEPPVLPPSA